MIIGLSGKMQSGKNTVASIINQLTNDMFVEKSFANKLKECVSLIIGIPRKDLEKEEVKCKVLGEEWMYYTTLNFDTDKYEKCSYLGNQDRYPSIPHATTVREILQEFGTEVGRQIHPDTWVNALFSDYREYYNALEFNNANDAKLYNKINHLNWIITDVRFKNELEAIKNRKGIIIRITRPFTNPNDHNIQLVGQHISETALDNATFDYTINNNGAIEDLVEKVKEILIKEKII